jgi:pyruvate dehydrogenase E1 component beta subunit
MDYEMIINSVKKTNRLVVVDESWPFAGVSSEIAYMVQKHAFDHLDAPVVRVNSADVSLGYAPTLVEEFLPNVKKIIDAVKSVSYVS